VRDRAYVKIAIDQLGLIVIEIIDLMTFKVITATGTVYAVARLP